MANLVGQQLGNYRLLRLLGQGGFAEVYLGEHIYLKTKAAIKVLHTQLAKTELEVFLNEARTVAHLVHPHIVRVLEFGVEGSIPFLVMDYASNGTLRHRHPKGTTLPLSTILSYLKQIAPALQYAHGQKLIHRDIKPENMLLGSHNEVLLSDFGIALIAHSSRSQSTKEMAGTVPYMAPEQIQGKPRLASDQYALGIVVYEWLSGDRPFRGSFTEIATQHLLVPPPLLHDKVPTISPAVQEVVLTALAKDPHQRFTSVQAFVNALEQAGRTETSPPSISSFDLPLPSTSSQSFTPEVSLASMASSSNGPFSTTNSTIPLLPPTKSSSTSPSSLTPSASTPFQPGDWSKRHLSRRTVILSLAGLALTGGGITWLALSQKHQISGSGTTPSPSSINMAGPIDMQTLITNAMKEGQLQAIGIPPEWADYAAILAGYTSKYGIPVSYKVEAEYSSAQELVVFKNSMQHPHGDIGDVGFKFGPQAVQQGLVTPYKHAHWADIPDSLKDPNGNWCTEYYGAQALIVNTDIVKNPPTSFQDLLNNSYKNMVGIDGDPRQANDAFLAVFSASLANGGSLDNIQPGIDFFARLKQNGNFTVARSSDANIAKGAVAIAIMWDYLGLGFRDAFKAKPNLSVHIPSDASIAGPYVSIVNKTAPNPYAARLWIEYIFSDEGQLFYLKGYAHPARYQTLVAAGKVPADLAAKLPSPTEYTNVKFPSPVQMTAASTIVAQNWGPQVLGS